MPAWLWVDSLSKRNDWMEVPTFRLQPTRGGAQLTLVVVPDRLAPDLMTWLTSGKAKEVTLFVEPQTEWHLSQAMLASLSTRGGDEEDLFSLAISYIKLTKSYSGTP